MRDIICRILRSNIPIVMEGLDSMNEFPYSSESMNEPQHIDPITDYVLDWNAFSTNDSVFEFPKEEFEIGMKMERNKDGRSQIMDIARKVIDNLSVDPQFYSNLMNRRS